MGTGDALTPQKSFWDRVKEPGNLALASVPVTGLPQAAWKIAFESYYDSHIRGTEGHAGEAPTETSPADVQVPTFRPPTYSTDQFPSGADQQQAAIGAGSDAYMQYMDERTDAWRRQQEAIDAQYGGNIARQGDRIDDLGGRLGGSMDAYGRFEGRMAGLDTEIPYGAIADADTSRVSEQFDAAEGRLGEALNLAPDEFSNQMIGEIRYFEDVTEMMLADDIGNIESLHELGALYAQAIADEVYTGTSLEAERSKLELRAQFERSIYDAQREMQRMQAEQNDALKRANDQFQIDYPEFDANREAITEATFFDMMKQQGMSAEDTMQSWAMYQGIYNDYGDQIATQADFNKFFRRELNDQTVALLHEDMAGQLQYLWATNPATLDPLSPTYDADMAQYEASIRVRDFLERHDLAASIFYDDNPSMTRDFLGMLRGAGFSDRQVSDFYEKGIEAAELNNLNRYQGAEARATRQAYQISNQVDDNWEDIYFQAMSIPVDSQYVHKDPTSQAVFPVAGPEVAFNQSGNVATSRGTPVVSTKRGTVVQVDYTPQDGHFIIVKHADGTGAKYAHLDGAPNYQPGGEVLGGTSIGRVGNSGSASTDPYALYFTYWDRNGVEADPSSLFGGYGGTG